MKISKLLIIALLQFVTLNAGTITIKNGPGPQVRWQIRFEDDSDQPSSQYQIPNPNSSTTYTVSGPVTKCKVWSLGSSAYFYFPCKPNATYQLITRQSSTKGFYKDYQDLVGASEVTQ